MTAEFQRVLSYVDAMCETARDPAALRDVAITAIEALERLSKIDGSRSFTSPAWSAIDAVERAAHAPYRNAVADRLGVDMDDGDPVASLTEARAAGALDVISDEPIAYGADGIGVHVAADPDGDASYPIVVRLGYDTPTTDGADRAMLPMVARLDLDASSDLIDALVTADLAVMSQAESLDAAAPIRCFDCGAARADVAARSVAVMRCCAVMS